MRNDPKLVNSVCPRPDVIDLKNPSKEPSQSSSSKEQEEKSSPKDDIISRPMSRKRRETRYPQFSHVGYADRKKIRFCSPKSPEDSNGKMSIRILLHSLDSNHCRQTRQDPECQADNQEHGEDSRDATHHDNIDVERLVSCSFPLRLINVDEQLRVVFTTIQMCSVREISLHI